MSAKPTKLPEWASSGTHIIEPSAGKKSDGHLSGEQPVPDYVNWVLNTNYQWAQYVNAVFTASGTATGDIALSGGATFGGTVVAANVTTSANVTATGYVDGATVCFENPVTRLLSQLSSTDVINGAPGGVHSKSRYGWSFAANNVPVYYDLAPLLQSGDVITEFTLSLTKTTDAAHTVKAELIQTTSVGDAVVPGTTFTNSAANPGTVILGGTFSVAVAGLPMYYLRITPSGAAGDSMGLAQVSFKRPHP